VRNVTVSIDEETYRRVRIRAAELNRSVSSLVREFLADLGSTETETERLKRQEQALRAEIRRFRAGDRVPRDELHNRR
jgi:plasmid stability protein